MKKFDGLHHLWRPYTHRRMSIDRSVLLTSVVQLPSVLLGFVSGICITRMLQDAGRGYYTVLQADVVLLTLLVSFNLGAGVLYFLARDESGRDRLIGLACTVTLVIGTLIALSLLVVRSFGMPANPLFPSGVDGFPFVAYVAGTVFFSLTNSLFHSVFAGLRLFRVVNQMTLVTAISTAIVFGGMFVWSKGEGGKDGLWNVLVASFVLLVGLNLLWLVYYLVHVRVRPVLFRGGALLKPVLAFVLVGYLANLLNLLNYRFDVWYVLEVRGAGELGLYAVAVGVAQFFFQVPEPIARVLQPHLIGGFDKPMLDKFRLYARLSSTVVLAGALVMMALAEWLFPFLYGDVFAGSAKALRWLMPGILFACISKMMVLLVVRTGKVKYNALASGVGLVATIVMNMILVPKVGFVGAAIASSVAYLAILVVVLWVVFRRLGVPWDNYYLLMPADLVKLRG
mgnify:CR=1 FL=1